MATAEPTAPNAAVIQEQYLSSGSTERAQILTLTDEEIVAVDHSTQSVVPLYWYSQQTPADKRLALAVASRGLVARGWAQGDPTATSTTDLALVPADPLAALLDLRKTARLIVLAEQKSTLETRARAYYLQTGDSALEEAVNSGGLHRFSTLPQVAAISDLALWCDPYLSPTPDNPWSTRVDSPDDLESVASSRLGDTRIVTVVAAVAPATTVPSRRYLTVYVGDGRLSVCGLEQGDGWIRDVSHRELVERLTAMVQ